MNIPAPYTMDTLRTLRMEDPVSGLRQFIDNPNPATADSPYALDSLVIMAERETGMWTVRLHHLRKEAYRVLCERQIHREDGIVKITNTLQSVRYSLRRATDMDADVRDLQEIFDPHYEKTMAEYEACKEKSKKKA